MRYPISMSLRQTSPSETSTKCPAPPASATTGEQDVLSDLQSRMMSLDLVETGSPSIHCSPKHFHVTHDFPSVKVPAVVPNEDDLTQKNISADGLADRMRKPNPFLLLDCRPFTVYNNHHVTGALNMTCSDRFNRRRLDKGKCRVADLICGAECKKLFKELSSSDVILYDDSTSQEPAQSTPIMSVSAALSKEGRHHSILKGGFQTFQDLYPSLCFTPQAMDTSERLYSPTTPVMERTIIDAPVGQVLPYLYIGNAHDSADRGCLLSHGITHIVNATSNVPLHFLNKSLEDAADDTKQSRDGASRSCIKYCHLTATDTAHQDLAQYFDKVFHFIEDARSNDGRVFVHCQAGVSRSATLCIAYIMRRTVMSMLDAYKYVKSKRSIIAPNFNFMGQLLEFEQVLKDGRVERVTSPALELC